MLGTKETGEDGGVSGLCGLVWGWGEGCVEVVGGWVALPSPAAPLPYRLARPTGHLLERSRAYEVE